MGKNILFFAVLLVTIERVILICMVACEYSRLSSLLLLRAKVNDCKFLNVRKPYFQDGYVLNTTVYLNKEISTKKQQQDKVEQIFQKHSLLAFENDKFEIWKSKIQIY